MYYIAHLKENVSQKDNKKPKNEKENVQTVKDHLEGTAALAEKFAIQELKPLVRNSGLLHDIGKYQPDFQKRIRGSHIKVDHSSSGAIEAGKLYPGSIGMIMKYIIAGHHAGLPDGCTMNELCEDKKDSDNFRSAEVYRKEISLQRIDKTDAAALAQFMGAHLKEYEGKMLGEAAVDEFAFVVRYCYSCLVDADSLDTEHFCRDISRETLHSDFSLCLERLEKVMAAFANKKNPTPLQAARTRLQQQAYQNITRDGDIYLMNMPTGSGKTLCSAKCALMKALSEHKNHIIYIIPYNSIISQTADEFEKVFNPDGEDRNIKAAHILRHQSTYSIEDDENADDEYKMHVTQATENWDADIVITTAVQFFETVFSNKRSKLRKMHNMADSVLIFDEAHLMPVKFFQPCLESVAYLTKMFGSKAIFLTATMPDYEKLLMQYTFKDLNIVSLVPDPSDFGLFKKCEYQNLGSINNEQLFEKMQGSASTLIVVNRRDTARELYKLLDGDHDPNVYHLSTYMTKYDLGKTIDEIKTKLEAINNSGHEKSAEDQISPLVVVSTSLIEAGVDLDFQTVFRECTGLDSILQAGGRCNREGRRNTGHVYIFEIEGSKRKADDIRTAVTRSLLKENEDISSPECIREYFRRVYESNSDEIEINSMHSFMENTEGLSLRASDIPFRSYEGKLIFSLDESLIVPENEEAERLINQISYQGISHSLMRRIQKYTCSVPRKIMEALFQQGVLEEISGGSRAGGIFILRNRQYYNSQTGIQIEGDDYYI